jgi:hypothetical protein
MIRTPNFVLFVSFVVKTILSYSVAARPARPNAVDSGAALREIDATLDGGVP